MTDTKRLIRILIRRSLRKNTELKSNQYEILEGNYEFSPTPYSNGFSEKHPCIFVDVDEISAEEGWSRGDLEKIADDIKVEVLRYADEKDTMIKVYPFVDQWDNIVVQY